MLSRCRHSRLVAAGDTGLLPSILVSAIVGLVGLLLAGLAVAGATVMFVATLPVVIVFICASSTCPETIVGLADLIAFLAVIISRV